MMDNRDNDSLGTLSPTEAMMFVLCLYIPNSLSYDFNKKYELWPELSDPNLNSTPLMALKHQCCVEIYSISSNLLADPQPAAPVT